MGLKYCYVLLFLVCGTAINLRAQSKEVKNAGLTEAQQKQMAQRIEVFKRSRHARAQSTDVQVQTNKYNHRESEILAKLNSDAIPADFPVYKTEYTDEHYTMLMNNWYALHPSMLKKENVNEQK